MDIFDKIRRKKGALAQYREEGRGYYMFPKLEGEISPRMKFRGKEMLNWSLNNYIGLANHPEVRKADAEGASQWGMAYPMGARMMSGHTNMHEELERQLAAFVGKEDAYLLNYGYQGMVSIIDSLVDRHDVIVYDSEAHACILDGLRLHTGKRFVYPHNNIENLEKQLERAEKLTGQTGGGILVITEGVYGMAGDLGKLKDIVELKKRHTFRLLVDDAHGFGTMGKTGAGTGEHFGVQDRVDVYFATFAKAMAGIGAFVAGDAEIIDFLRFDMRSQIFAKSLPMPMVAGALKRLELLKTRPELREKLWTIVKALQDGLREKGFDLGKTNTCVTPVYMKGGVFEAANMIADFRENYGIFLSIVLYPVVPKGDIIIRIVPSSTHTLEDVEITLNAFSEVAQKLKNKKYNSETFAIR